MGGGVEEAVEGMGRWQGGKVVNREIGSRGAGGGNQEGEEGYSITLTYEADWRSPPHLPSLNQPTRHPCTLLPKHNCATLPLTCARR